MARLRVEHTIDALLADEKQILARARGDMSRTVRKNVAEGLRLAKNFAIESSGPHGKLYYKRITGEMTSPLTGEYGPHGVVDNNAVGASWRHGAPNTDLPRSADIVGPKFSHDVQ